MGDFEKLTVSEFVAGPREWEELLARSDEPSLVQAWAYGEAKARTSKWTIERVAVRKGAEIVALVQAQVRLLPMVGRGLVWVNRAPVVITGGSALGFDEWSALLDALHGHWVVKRRLLLRVGLPCAVEKGAELKHAAFSPVDDRTGWASARVDLTPDLDAIRKGLDSKWRASLSKSERCGLELVVGSDGAAVGEFCSDYERFLTERGYTTSVSPALLGALADCSGEGMRPLVFSARKDGRGVGAIFVARFGSTYEYLAAVNKDEGREFCVSNFLLWAAIAQAKAAGCRSFDVGGAHPVDTPKGIFSFKAGMKGKPYHYVGTLEAGGDLALNRLIKRFIPA